MCGVSPTPTPGPAIFALMSDRHPPPPPRVVLVVDDEPEVLELMARTLREDGYVVHTARNGLDALRVAERLGRPLDVVVTDVRMDPIGGPELAEKLFARGLSHRFLLVSGYGSAPEYNDQFGPVLAKPFSPERLLEAVAKLLR